VDVADFGASVAIDLRDSPVGNGHFLFADDRSGV
jgi:hypothetical protein